MLKDVTSTSRLADLSDSLGIFNYLKTSFKVTKEGSLGGAAVWRLPLA